MITNPTTNSLEQQFDNVNISPSNPDLLSPGLMIHHKERIYRYPDKRIFCKSNEGKRYGVSRSYRVLSPQILNKKWNYIVDCLNYRIRLTYGQQIVVLELLRLWAYYGYVYPKQSQVSQVPGCSKSTFWRTIAILREMGLVKVVNRYIFRPHAQISNLYVLDSLVQVIARYLAEKGSWLFGEWLLPVLEQPDLVFWSFLSGGTLKLPGLNSYCQL